MTHNRVRREASRLRVALEALPIPEQPVSNPAWRDASAVVGQASELLRAVAALVQAQPAAPEVALLGRYAVERWRAALGAAYPPGFWEMLDRLRIGETPATEPGITFLEADPWFFRSGYAKQRLLRLLAGQAYIAAADRQRLRAVILAVVDGRSRREFRFYCRLARRVASPELRGALAEKLAAPAERTRRHARWMLDALEGG
jgi:hypothetical protein